MFDKIGTLIFRASVIVYMVSSLYLIWVWDKRITRLERDVRSLEFWHGNISEAEKDVIHKLYGGGK